MFIVFFQVFHLFYVAEVSRQASTGSDSATQRQHCFKLLGLMTSLNGNIDNEQSNDF